MLLVLGDISARGSELTKSKWSPVLQQFESMLGPFVGLPLHIVLGDRDVGQCDKLDEKFVSQIASHLPGLDSAGCSAFEIGNISFVSLNAVALLCSNNALRVGVEKAIERESVDLRTQMKDATREATEPNAERASFSFTPWRDNDMASGSGPVLLLHFPLHQKIRSNGGMIKVVEEDLWYDTSEDLRSSKDRYYSLSDVVIFLYQPINVLYSILLLISLEIKICMDLCTYGCIPLVMFIQ